MSRRGLSFLFVGSLLVALLLQLLLLPKPIALFAPLWVALVLGYWAVFGPNYPVLFMAFVLGLVLDVAYAAPLGQNALALVLIAYACTNLRVTIGRFLLVQQAIALLPCFLVYCLLLFWLDGMARHPSDALMRFVPAFSSALLWAPLCLLMEAMGGRAAR